MKKATIERIINNATYNRADTVIGKHTYRFDANTGCISRCLTDDIGREWIDNDGRVSSAWVTAAHA